MLFVIHFCFFFGFFFITTLACLTSHFGFFHPYFSITCLCLSRVRYLLFSTTFCCVELVYACTSMMKTMLTKKEKEKIKLFLSLNKQIDEMNRKHFLAHQLLYPSALKFIYVVTEFKGGVSIYFCR